MGISLDIRGLESYLEKRLDDWIGALIEELEVIAESMRKTAVLDGDYKDQTGALRASIGYAIAINGNLIALDGFGEVKAPIKANANKQKEGVSQGRSYAREIAESHKKGIIVVLVAGRNYAKYVSARYNVLDSAKLVGEKLMNDLKGKDLI